MIAEDPRNILERARPALEARWSEEPPPEPVELPIQPNLQPYNFPVGTQVLEAGGDELASSKTTVANLPYLPLLGSIGWFVKGWSHMLSGYPRVGKTDLAVAVIRHWLDQGERILYLTEEPRPIWEARLAALPGDWSGLRVVFALGTDVEVLRRRAREGAETIVIVDALRNLLQLKDENDNSEVARVTNPWIGDARASDKTLLMLHHNRKGGGEHGEGVAGGHALMGGFDIVIEVLRDSNQAKNRRLLRSYARLIESRESLYERTDAGDFRFLGNPRDVGRDEVTKRLQAVLTDDLQTTKELHELLGEPKPSVEQTRLALEAMAKRSDIRRDPSVASGTQRGKTYRWGLLIPETT